MGDFFYDTEFLERGPDERIELISIGVVAANGAEFYRQSHNFVATNASEWVRDNVISQLVHKECYGSALCMVRGAQSCPWRVRAVIARELEQFVRQNNDGNPVRLIAHFADYDHVVLAQMFGIMLNLPKGFPMWTFDLKQHMHTFAVDRVPIEQTGEHNALADARWVRDAYRWVQDVHIPHLIDSGRLLTMFDTPARARKPSYQQEGL